MAGQTEVIGSDGRSPPKAVARGVSELAHDFTALVELQAQLFRLDLGESLRRLVTPCALALGAVLVAAGSVPIALWFLAELLSGPGGLSRTWALAIATLVGLATAGLMGFAAWANLRAGFRVFERSREEWMRTIRWAQRVLKHGVPSAS
jgi:hypothetical protein